MIGIKDEKILQDEIMSDEELENVAGGTVGELEDIWRAFSKADIVKTISRVYSHVPGVNKWSADIVQHTLRTIGIEANISLGFLGTGLGSNPNTYTEISTGKRLSHSEVLNIINKKYDCSDE